MKFIAKALTLDIEVVTLDGETKRFSVPPLNADKACALLDKIVQEEMEWTESKTKDKDERKISNNLYTDGIDFIDYQLSSIYNTTKGFWKDNFDRNTLVEIKTYIVNQLNGTSKNA